MTAGPFVAMAAGIPFEAGPNPGLVLAPFAAVALALLALQAFRRGTEIDRRRGQFVRWWGFVVPWRRREMAVGRVTGVRVDLAPAPWHPTALLLTFGERSLGVATFWSAQGARAAAADLVAFLGVPGRERSGDDDHPLEPVATAAAAESDARSSTRGGPTRDRWERVSGGREVLGIRLVTTAMGLAFATMPFWFFGPRQGNHWPQPAFVVFGAVGGAMFTGFGWFASRMFRRQVTLDRATGIATRRAPGPAGLAGGQRARLADFAHVTLDAEQSGGGKNSAEYTAYVVGLAAGRAAPFELVVHRSLDAARRDAESAARFCRLPLHDASGGAAVIRPLDTLDESLAARATRTGERPPAPGAPPGARLQVRTALRGTTIDLPAHGLGAPHLGGIVAALVVAGLLGWLAILPGARHLLAFLIGGTDSPPVQMLRVFGGVVGLAIAGASLEGALRVFRHRTLAERVEIGRSGLAAEWRRGPLRRQRWLPADAIEEIELAVRPPGIARRAGENVVRIWSDAGRIEVGLTLDPAERAWLCGALRHHLSG